MCDSDESDNGSSKDSNLRGVNKNSINDDDLDNKNGIFVPQHKHTVADDQTLSSI